MKHAFELLSWRSEEPLFAAFLKVCAVICGLLALIAWVQLMMTPPVVLEKARDAEEFTRQAEEILAIGRKASAAWARGIVFTAGAISIWWFSEVISWLAKIADRLQKTQASVLLGAKPQSRKPDDEGLGRYKL